VPNCKLPRQPHRSRSKPRTTATGEPAFSKPSTACARGGRSSTVVRCFTSTSPAARHVRHGLPTRLHPTCRALAEDGLHGDALVSSDYRAVAPGTDLPFQRSGSPGGLSSKHDRASPNPLPPACSVTGRHDTVQQMSSVESSRSPDTLGYPAVDMALPGDMKCLQGTVVAWCTAAWERYTCR
jgi:hypothetical protein